MRLVSRLSGDVALARPAMALLLSALMGAAAQAQSASPDAPAAWPAQCQQLLENATTDKDLQPWIEQVPACQNHPHWLASLGHLLNAQGRYKDAADHLERALMLDPELIDAQIDYAIALAGAGDPVSARGLLDNVLAMSTLPEHLRQPLRQQMASLANARTAQPASAWQTRFQLGASVGRDSNLLGAPNLTGLPLTFDGNVLILPLESGYLAQAGDYYRTEAQLHARRREPGQAQWDLQASAYQRASPGVDQAAADQYELMVERNTIDTPADLPAHTPSFGNYARAHLANLHTRVSGRYKVQALAAGLGHWVSWGPQGQSCQARAGGEWQTRNFLDNTVLSGEYKGLTVHWSCLPAQNPATSVQHWQAALRLGQDNPQDANRVGGAQSQLALQMQWVLPASQLLQGAAGQWQLDSEWSHARDSQGYSAWLENGDRRKMSKTIARIEYQRFLRFSNAGPAWQLKAGFEYLRNHSNLPLFALRSSGPYVGFRVHW